MTHPDIRIAEATGYGPVEIVRPEREEIERPIDFQCANCLRNFTESFFTGPFANDGGAVNCFECFRESKRLNSTVL